MTNNQHSNFFVDQDDNNRMITYDGTITIRTIRKFLKDVVELNSYISTTFETKVNHVN